MEPPDLSRETLTVYLSLREDYLRVQYVDVHLVGHGMVSDEEALSTQVNLWDRVRELHRLRLVLLGLPAPSLREWAEGAIQEAAADPEAWADKRRRAVELSFEMMGEGRSALPADPVDRVTAGYRRGFTMFNRFPCVLEK